jgi:NAD(P)-dependent dehydrogenase (short-subunit alcohol dehydrogenase family)
VLVNAAARPAGGAPIPKLTDLTDDAVQVEFDTKVMGYLRTARAVAPSMIAQGAGRIVNISGLNARKTGSIAGTIRNVAVAALTANLADELGPQGINVTCVHPGITDTERTPGMLADIGGSSRRPRWRTWSRSWPRPARWRSRATRWAPAVDSRGSCTTRP